MFYYDLRREYEILSIAAQGVIKADEKGIVYKLAVDNSRNAPEYNPINMNGNQLRFDYKGRQYRMAASRFVWMYHNHSCIPFGAKVVHRDGDRANNAIANLECIPNADSTA